MFHGFSTDGLDLLRELPSLDTEAFHARKDRYAASLQGPLKAFVGALGPVLCERISPGIAFEARTHGSIGPINNDVRFNPGGPTYKDHVLLRFWEGTDRKTAPALYVRLTPDEVGFASGMAFPDVDAWRSAVDADGAALQESLDSLDTAPGAHRVEPELKRVPRPYAADHPRADLLRHKSLQVRWLRPLPSSVGNAGFVDFCGGELARAAGVHRWFVQRLG